MSNLWATKNRIIPQDWKDFASAVLEAGPQLQWRAWWREEIRALEQQGRTRGHVISQDQILSEGQY